MGVPPLERAGVWGPQVYYRVYVTHEWTSKLRSFHFFLTNRLLSDDGTHVLQRLRQSCGGTPAVVNPGTVMFLCGWCVNMYVCLLCVSEWRSQSMCQCLHSCPAMFSNIIEVKKIYENCQLLSFEKSWTLNNSTLQDDQNESMVTV